MCAIGGDYPDASVTFNVNKLRLEISVPQIAIKSNARGYVPPERWDEGINALLLGYPQVIPARLQVHRF